MVRAWLLAITVAACSLVPGGIGRDRAVELARQVVGLRLPSLVDARPGYLPPDPAAQARRDPQDRVWQVTFNGILDICPPDGSPCFQRPGTSTIYLDYSTGEFIQSSASSTGP
jgi:hypothetical protein